MGLGRCAAALVVVLASSCAKPQGSSARPQSAPELYRTWATTSELVAEPAKRTRVDAFAAKTMKQGIRPDGTFGIVPTVEGPAIGEDGKKSELFASHRELAASLSREENVALLRHENPAVRAYFASHVGATMRAEASSALYALLADESSVLTVEGCVGRPRTVAEIALDALKSAGRREDLFVRVAGDARLPAHVRGAGLGHLATIAPGAARPIARAAASDTMEAWRREGVRVLGEIGDAEDVALLASATKDASDPVREAAAAALGEIDSEPSAAALVPLLKDSSASVRRAAARAYAMQSCADPKIVAQLLDDEQLASPAAHGLVENGSLRALELLEPALMKERSPVGVFELEELLRRTGAAAVPVARRLLGSRSGHVRAAAIGALARQKDVESVPAIRNALVDPSTKIQAEEALEALGAR